MNQLKKNIYYYNYRESLFQAIKSQNFIKEKSIIKYFETIYKYLKRQTIYRNIFGYNNINRCGNLSIFVVRNNAIELNLLEPILHMIRRFGFDVLDVVELERSRIDDISKELRGGNWSLDSGSSKSANGLPEAFIVTFDPNPIKVTKKYYYLYPDMDNNRLVLKRRIRLTINKIIKQEKESNFIHATDNEKEAWEYIQVAIPEREKIIKSKIHLNYCRCSKCQGNIYINKAKEVCKKCGNSNNSHKTTYLQNKYIQKIKYFIYYYLYQSLWWLFHSYLRKIKFSKINKNIYYYIDPCKPPNDIYSINTNAIKYIYGGYENKSIHFMKFDKNLVINGVWETNNNEQQFTNSLFYKAAKDIFINHKNWTDTEYFLNRIDKINNDKSLMNVFIRIDKLEHLYYQMKENGYKMQQLLNNNLPSARCAQGWGEIAIHIGKHGDIYLAQGRHRATYARLLNIPTVYVNIIVRHYKWVTFKNEILNYISNNNNLLEMPLTHVDLQYIPSSYDMKNYNTIKKNINKKLHNILVIEIGWGYYCHKLEEDGYDCVLFNNNMNDMYYINKLIRAEDRNFKLINEMCNLVEKKEFNYEGMIIIGLKIIEIIEIENNQQILINILNKIKEVIYQPMVIKNINNNYDIKQDKFINFVIDNSKIKNINIIGKSIEGNPIYKMA